MIFGRLQRAVVALLFAAGVAGCGAGNEIAPGVVSLSSTAGPVAPGTVRFSLENPNKDNWDARIRQGAPDGSVRYGFTCKVVACPLPTTVVVTTRRAPTERPDPKTLEKLAKESIPKLTAAESLQLQVRSDNKAKAETLSSNVIKVGDYPAVFNETKLTFADNARYIAISTVFAGKIMVNIRAEAGDRATAKQSVDAFSKAFKVEEGATQ